mmetsp:Transcript_4177/g.8065  ORF Transcript_4177/g.8065 Transcript_4177/m.8065 type:complete len:82 (-) Transcript_4177:82-327(-)
MRAVSALFAFAAVASTSAFAPPTFGIRTEVCLSAKHVNKKGAKKAAADRPKKSRLSDINRKPTNYAPIVKPPEYTIAAGGN